jgi:hypothetical protein
MATTHLPVIGGHPQGPAQTVRKDSWWVGPAATFTFITAALTYLTWAMLQGEYYYAAPYLSPVYSPVLLVVPGVPGGAPTDHSWFGTWPTWWPAFLPMTPGMFALVAPGLFRFTCYYYRKAYYRSFAGSPVGCGVVPFTPGRTYRGETGLMSFQNLHRYAMYLAVAYLPILYYDAIIALWKDGQFGIGVGTLVLTLNAAFLSSYTFGCHSFRHVIGGHDDCMSCGKQTMRFSLWNKATWFNGRHMQFAWISLFWVAFTDFYVRMVAMGVITDFNTWD